MKRPTLVALAAVVVTVTRASPAAPPSSQAPQPVPAPIAPAALERNSAFITHVFEDLLGHPPDANAFVFYTRMLAQGGSRQQLVQSVVSSTEYQASQIAGVYTLLLHRSPGQAGTQYWLGVMSSGRTIEQIEALVAGTDEYYRNAGGTNPAYVSRLYTDVLGRSVDATGLRYFVALLLQGGVSRSAVAQSLLGTPEYADKVVAADYAQYLHRPVDAAGLQYMASLFQQSGGSRAVTIALLSSQEYFDRR